MHDPTEFEGEYDIDIASSPGGDVVHYHVVIRRVRTEGASEPEMSHLAEGLTSEDLQRATVRRFMEDPSHAVELVEAVDVDDVLTLLDEAEEHSKESARHGSSIREGLDLLRKELGRNS